MIDRKSAIIEEGRLSDVPRSLCFTQTEAAVFMGICGSPDGSPEPKFRNRLENIRYRIRTKRTPVFTGFRLGNRRKQDATILVKLDDLEKLTSRPLIVEDLEKFFTDRVSDQMCFRGSEVCRYMDRSNQWFYYQMYEKTRIVRYGRDRAESLVFVDQLPYAPSQVHIAWMFAARDLEPFEPARAINVSKIRSEKELDEVAKQIEQRRRVLALS